MQENLEILIELKFSSIKRYCWNVDSVLKSTVIGNDVLVTMSQQSISGAGFGALQNFLALKK